jgi:hypothetical protein
VGIWGLGPLQNDAALDWLGDFRAEWSAKFLEQTLRRRSWENGEETLAAAEIVAAILTRPHETSDGVLSLPAGRSVAARLPELRPRTSKILAAEAIAAVNDVEMDSELRELIGAGGEDDLAQWRSILEDIRTRLR